MGITEGTGETIFSPNKTSTRGEIVTFLWRYQYQPEAEQRDCPFTDVAPDRYYTEAVLWAVENEITNGKTETTFWSGRHLHPGAGCDLPLQSKVKGTRLTFFLE